MKNQSLYTIKKNALSFFLFMGAILLHAQSIIWEKNLGGSSNDFGYASLPTPDGGYIVTGYTNSSATGDVTGTNRGSSDAWVIKLDASGNISWQKNLGSSFNDVLYSVALTSDGGYAFIGYAGGANGDVTGTAKGSGDLWVVKLDANGNIVWQQLYGGSGIDQGTSIASTPDGGFIIGGLTYSSSNGDVTAASKGSQDAWVIKLNATGNIEWQKNYGGSMLDSVNMIKPTPDGGYVFVGPTTSSATGDVSGTSKGSNDFWAVKLEAAGAIIWEKNLGGTASDVANGLVVTSDGGYVICGTTSSSATGDVTGTSKGSQDIWAVKLGATGNPLWQKNIGGSAAENGTFASETTDGGYLITGSTGSSATGDVTGSGNGANDVWVVKLDVNGNLVSQKNFGGTAGDVGMSIIPLTDGNYFLSGYTASSASGNISSAGKGVNDFWVIKLNPLSLSAQQWKTRNWKILANPTRDFIHLSQLPLGCNIALYDPTGKLLFKTKATQGTISIGVNNYPNGNYFLKVGDETTKVLISK